MAEVTLSDIMEVIVGLRQEFRDEIKELKERVAILELRTESIANGMARREDMKEMQAEVRLLHAKFDRGQKDVREMLDAAMEGIGLRLTAAGI